MNHFETDEMHRNDWEWNLSSMESLVRKGMLIKPGHNYMKISQQGLDLLRELKMALARMVVPGDRIRDSKGLEWTVLRIESETIAVYDRKMETEDEYDRFIAEFRDHEGNVTEFNRNMTLVFEDDRS